MNTAAIGTSAPSTRSNFNWIVLGLCFSAIFFEGFQSQAVRAALPALADAWSLQVRDLASALSVSGLGALLGYVFVALLGAKLPRSLTLILSFGVCGASTALCAVAPSVLPLTIFLFMSTASLGAMLPIIVALNAEAGPAKWQISVVSLTAVAANSVGSGAARSIASGILALGWQSVYLVCGLLGLLLAVATAFIELPEGDTTAQFDQRLARPGRMTILLWVISFFSMAGYLLINSWLPVGLVGQGETIVTARLTGFTFGAGGLAVLFLAPLADLCGPRAVLGGAYLLAALVAVATMFLPPPNPAFSFLIFLIGVGAVGTRRCISGLAAKAYPSNIRVSGVAWVLAIGMIGGALGPFIGGVLVSNIPQGTELRFVLLAAAILLSIAGTSFLLLRRFPS